MRDKDIKICTWIHHTATILGIFMTARGLGKRGQGTVKRSVLSLFAVSQIWAVVKIITYAAAGRLWMKRSCDHIRKLGRTKKEERGYLWLFTAGSVLFKMGTPLISG